MMGLLTLLMFIPLFFTGSIVQERATYADEMVRTIGREWGGSQTLSGPFIVVPVEATEYVTKHLAVTDSETGIVRQEPYDEAIIVRRAPVLILPEGLMATIDTTTEIRSRAIVDVPVCAATVAMDVLFDPARADQGLRDDERLLWDEAVLRMTLSGNEGLPGATTVHGPHGPLDLSPFVVERRSGIEGATGTLDGLTRFPIDFTLNGSQDISLVPVARDTTLRMTGDWPDPAFQGAFLPDAREVTEAGYAATWTVPHLARALPQTQRADLTGGREYAFGTAFIQVNDFYQKAWRAARYGILVIARHLSDGAVARPQRPPHTSCSIRADRSGPIDLRPFDDGLCRTGRFHGRLFGVCRRDDHFADFVRMDRVEAGSAHANPDRITDLAVRGPLPDPAIHRSGPFGRGGRWPLGRWP